MLHTYGFSLHNFYQTTALPLRPKKKIKEPVGKHFSMSGHKREDMTVVVIARKSH